jgi:hypothetical protein
MLCARDAVVDTEALKETLIVLRILSEFPSPLSIGSQPDYREFIEGIGTGPQIRSQQPCCAARRDSF